MSGQTQGGLHGHRGSCPHHTGAAAPGAQRAVATGAGRRVIDADDTGSVTPLVIGMVLCLLLLSAGVTAATSAFLAHQRLQNACDGAAAAAADAAGAGYYNGSAGSFPVPIGSATEAAARYLSIRSPEVAAVADTSPGGARLTCTATSSITLGALFGTPRLTQTVQSVGRPVL